MSNAQSASVLHARLNTGSAGYPHVRHSQHPAGIPWPHVDPVAVHRRATDAPDDDVAAHSQAHPPSPFATHAAENPPPSPLADTVQPDPASPASLRCAPGTHAVAKRAASASVGRAFMDCIVGDQQRVCPAEQRGDCSIFPPCLCLRVSSSPSRRQRQLHARLRTTLSVRTA